MSEREGGGGAFIYNWRLGRSINWYVLNPLPDPWTGSKIYDLLRKAGALNTEVPKPSRDSHALGNCPCISRICMASTMGISVVTHVGWRLENPLQVLCKIWECKGEKTDRD